MEDWKLDDDFVNDFAGKANPLLSSFNGLGYVVYKRTYARPLYGDSGEFLRTEDWHETVRRVVEGAQRIGAGLTDEEARRLYEYIWGLKGFPGGRMLWQLGTDNNSRLGGDSLVNCWFVDITDVSDLGWMFERLMLGGGVGFSVTKPDKFGMVRQGKVVHMPNASDADFIVPDKREGWSELLMRTINAYLDGNDFSYSTMLVRPEGAPIRTFGGVASGPGILVEGIERITGILDAAVGRNLTSVELLDIANVIGSIVVSGNVRRSAQIAIGDPSDLDYLAAKRWDLGGIPAYRAMSNNSVYVDDIDELPEAFWEGYHGNGEPYGIINLSAAQNYARYGDLSRPDDSIVGFNPCAEIGLANRESCNLAEIALPHISSSEELQDVASLLYKVQKAVAALPYLDPESDRITSENMRLGLGVTGVLQANNLQLSWLPAAYKTLRVLDKAWSQKMDYPLSVRLTTVKPSGTLSLLAGVSPGAHPGFSQYHVRRVRMATNDPVFAWCQDQGYTWELVRDFEGVEDPRTAVVEFPCEFTPNTVFSHEVSAVEQMETVRFLQRMWADNAVSVTIYYEKHELPEIKKWMKDNWGTFKSMSFLLKSDHGFDQAPLEVIDKATYHAMMDAVDIRHTHIHAGESSFLDSDCEGGACPVR